MDGELGAVGTAVAADAGATPETPETNTPETPAEETPVGTPETPATPEAPATEESAPAEGEEGELSGEGESAEPGSPEEKIRKEIAALKKVNPAAAKAWAKDHYSLNAYQQEFGTVQEARAAKASLESLGGEEGITSLQEEVGDYRNEIEQFSNGDPALLEQLYQSNPESTITAAQNLLRLLAESKLEHFDAAMIPAMNQRLENAEVYDSIAALKQFIKDGDGQKAWDLIGKLEGWFGRLKGIAEKTGEKVKQRDPERDRFDQERQKFESEKAQHNDSLVAADVNKLNNSATGKVVEQFFKDIKLGTEGRKEFVDKLNQKIWAAMKNDKAFQRQAKAIKERGDVQKTARFVSAKFTELLPDNFRALRNALYPSYKPGKAAPPKPAANGAAPANGARPAAPAAGSNGALTTKPNREDVDWSKTSDVAWITGSGVVLKNGKTVNIDWKAVRA